MRVARYLSLFARTLTSDQGKAQVIPKISVIEIEFCEFEGKCGIINPPIPESLIKLITYYIILCSNF